VKIAINVNIVVAGRLICQASDKTTSFSAMMGLPNKQFDTIYWMPWQNNTDLDTYSAAVRQCHKIHLSCIAR
jgi:hypothetical protein